MGRPVLYAKEIYRMRIAEKIVKAYYSRKASSNWASWVIDNASYAFLLSDAEKLANE